MSCILERHEGAFHRDEDKAPSQSIADQLDADLLGLVDDTRRRVYQKLGLEEPRTG